MVDATILPEGRVCTKCAVWKPASEFYVSTRDGMFARCKACMYAHTEQWRAANPDAARASMARRKARRLARIASFPPVEKILRITPEGKLCSGCGVRKPVTQFTTDRANVDGRSHRCRDCARAAHRTWRSINSVELRKRYSRLHRLRKFGMTADDFVGLLSAQDYKCPVCSSELLLGLGKGKNACVDHDHESGKVRGILCSSCNRAIGLLKDEILLLRKAVSYLQRPPLCYQLM